MDQYLRNHRAGTPRPVADADQVRRAIPKIWGAEMTETRARGAAAAGGCSVMPPCKQTAYGMQAGAPASILPTRHSTPCGDKEGPWDLNAMLTSSHSVPDKRWHEEAAKGTLSAYEVAALLSPNNPDPARVTHLLTARQLLGVLHEGEMRFPAYQFNHESDGIGKGTRSNRQRKECLVEWLKASYSIHS